MNFDAVPIACADENWLHNEYSRAVDALVAGRDSAVYFFKADSDSEAKFLLQRLSNKFNELDVEYQRFNLSELDPTIGWTALIGDPDTPWMDGVVCDVLIVFGCSLIPNWFWEFHLDTIVQIAKVRCKRVIFSVSPNAFKLLDQVEGVTKWVDVPSLSSTSELLVRNLVVSRIERAFRENPLTEEIAERLAGFIVEQGPASRWAIEKFLFDLRDSALSTDESDVLSLAASSRETLLAFELDDCYPTKVTLRNSYKESLSTLVECRTTFDSFMNVSLFRDNQPLPDPFESSDPFHWFLCLIANLASLFVDAGKRRGLSIIHKFKFDDSTEDVVAVEEPSKFRSTLQALRTYFLHGLDPSNQGKKIDAALSWLELSRFAPKDSRACGRNAVKKLLSEFRELVQDASLLISKLESCPTNYMVADSILGEQLTVEQFELVEITSKVIEYLKLELNPVKIAEKRGEEIAKRLKASNCDPEFRLHEVERIAEQVCIEESRRFPNIGKKLVELGLVKRELGVAQEQLRKRWEDNSSLSTSDILGEAENIASAIIERREV